MNLILSANRLAVGVRVPQFENPWRTGIHNYKNLVSLRTATAVPPTGRAGYDPDAGAAGAVEALGAGVGTVAVRAVEALGALVTRARPRVVHVGRVGARDRGSTAARTVMADGTDGAGHVVCGNIIIIIIITAKICVTEPKSVTQE